MQVKRGRARWLVLVASLAIAAPVFAVASGSANGSPKTGVRALEMDISGNGSKSNMGEPEIAVNPLNQSEMYMDGATFPVPLVFDLGSSPYKNTCGGWTSDNGGLSWSPSALPLKVCEDGVAVFGPDGTLYAGGDVATSTTVDGRPPCPPGDINVGICILAKGYDPVLMSTDGGHSWGSPVIFVGSNTDPGINTLTPPFHFVNGSGNPINTWDRPWLAVDQSTGVVYGAGHNIVDHEGFVTALTSKLQPITGPGVDPGAVYAMDSTDYPSGGLFGGNIAAAHGELAVAYSATSAPAAALPPGVTCPCVIFETSTDYGKTFDRHVVPLHNATKAPLPFVAANPVAPGHFALTVFDSTGTENQVYVTDDSGKNWHGPTTVGETPGGQGFKPWISFGPSGQLALMWRTMYSDHSYDVWAAVGRDEGHNGAVFSTPMRVTTAGVPAAPYPPGYQGGDDFSFVIATNKYLNVGWGDSRDTLGTIEGGVQIWYSRIPLTAFQGNR